MKDQEFYKIIGQNLYNESPDISKTTNAHCHIFNGGIDMTFWVGSTYRGATFSMSSGSSKAISDCFIKLYKFYHDNQLSNWNVAHYVLHPQGVGFDIKFNFDENLKSGKIPYWKYMRENY